MKRCNDLKTFSSVLPFSVSLFFASIFYMLGDVLRIEIEGVVKATGPGKMVIAKKNVRYWFVSNAKLVEVENCDVLKSMKKDERRRLHGKTARVIIEVVEADED
jgi:ABC-type antimicrobial peptide transport system ATPase subunit